MNAATVKKRPKPAKAKQVSKKSAKQSPDRQKKMLGLLDDAIALRVSILDATREVEWAKEKLKAAKERLDARNCELNEIIGEIEAIRDGKPYQNRLPLEGEAGTNGHPKGDEALIVLKLTDSLLEKLGEAEITTVPQLEKAMAEGKFVPNRIKGIGQTAVDRVTDALVKYRAEHPIAGPSENAEPPKKDGDDSKPEGTAA